MLRVAAFLLALLTFLHGLIHLLGFLAYWPLAVIPQLPYKTALLGGRLAAGPAGMRIFAALWLLAGLAFVVGALLLSFRKRSWAPVMLGAALLSLVLCVLDWPAAALGVWLNLAVLLTLGVVFGFQAAPAPFPAGACQPGPVETMALPAGLPEPVERFYRQRYGDQIPIYHSAVISGRGTVVFAGIPMPARLRFTHELPTGYHHYMETTFFGRPLLRVNEHYLDGASRFELPFGVIENEPTQDSAANQGFWAEFIAYPAAYVTDPRARWTPLDGERADLHIPYGAGEQVLTVTFDLHNTRIRRVETMRYRDVKGELIHWWGDVTVSVNGLEHWDITWGDQGTPWLMADVEEVLLNCDVSSAIRQAGP